MAKKKTTTSARLKGEIQPSEPLTVGIDMHKRSYSIAVWSHTREEIVFHARTPGDNLAVINLLGRWQSQLELVVYEAGPTGFSLARTLLAHDFPAKVVSAAHMPECQGDKEKNDRYDAAKLARFGALGLLREVYIPTEEEEGERAVVRLREDAAKAIRRKKQQIKSQLLRLGVREPEGLRNWSKASLVALRGLKLRQDERFVLDDLLDELERLEERKKRIEKKIEEIAARDHHKKRVERLCEIDGIGKLTAMTFLLELLCPERFESGRQVGKMLGLAPLVRSSGETRREMGRDPAGNSRLRTVLIEAAWRWQRRDKAARKRFEGHCRKTASRKKAITAMARHLGIIMWKMTVNEESYCAEKVFAAA